MIVTDLNYALENKLVQRLDRFADMATRKKQIEDVLFTVHGRTGSGKTNSALLCAYYLSSITKREVHLFFSTEKASEFIKATRKKIIIIDEPSLDLLSGDHATKLSKNFMRLLNTMRQKRHIIIVCITRFWRFPIDLVVDRSLAMINMHTAGGKSLGRFQYIRQKNLERLWENYQRFRKKDFGKLKSFGGDMPERMEKKNLSTGKPYFDSMNVWIDGKPNCSYTDYKNFRDNTIKEIGSVEKSKKEIKVERDLWKVRFALASLVKLRVITARQGAELAGVNKGRMVDWYDKGIEKGFSLEKPLFEVRSMANIENTMGVNQENQPSIPASRGLEFSGQTK